MDSQLEVDHLSCNRQGQGLRVIASASSAVILADAFTGRVIEFAHAVAAEWLARLCNITSTD